ncbi:hypothetical protein HKBW3S42_01496 [Candidatus Hakubella thermalkaliphila]|uniref:Uncharacterized protein n=1 Tax=Candidatus Hakubella thermalkaliphila TaxID=2754717 RepID=A0A6V8PKI0_9ACTN|nr:hypothetical protein HKBW3S42_01496 [Candidatus Hakubella thermalkaliphila]GFP37396.1 hypothetical protein HKBW3S44_01076 [Candidatus Hakubella thermalkaliphila]GFP38800.1 hypothetical protein HKBW3S47_00501 [Candidatus Hakubella thermalkaliphila]
MFPLERPLLWDAGPSGITGRSRSHLSENDQIEPLVMLLDHSQIAKRLAPLAVG